MPHLGTFCLSLELEEVTWTTFVVTMVGKIEREVGSVEAFGISARVGSNLRTIPLSAGLGFAM